MAHEGEIASFVGENVKVHMTVNKEQSDKFKDAARDLDCDEDEGRWEKRLKKVVKEKPEDAKGVEVS
ncbi:hypothetical protein B5C34_06630 [Pacificimonas flava]|uniref:Uncharacterized protein n=2 Tax=Pacificimonas TaxID=1960290 RepID=A0A219B5T7_9SPHN|nr:hypothetical protein [Pacificimonas aurantium]MBZ6377101.1 hypothetical protein [Pacificimonas aurantium]OWV33169.1 hypothetical protein B5C34_06630 [Pacificimonas flava]